MLSDPGKTMANLEDIRRLRGMPQKQRISYKRLAIICVPLVVVTAFIVFFYGFLAETRPEKVVVRVEKHTLSLFTPGNDGRLLENTIEIDSKAGPKEKADIIMGELKKAGSVPQAVSLQEVVTDSDGIMYLNFSKNFVDDMDAAGTLDEITALYSITNSFLASFRYSKKIQLLADWQPIYTAHGVLYTFSPIEFNKQVTED
jgi:hypothetical protein